MTRPLLPSLFEPRPCSWLANLQSVVKPRPDPTRDARVEARRFAATPAPITGWGSL